MVQVLGRSVVDGVVEALAARSWTPEIAGWIRRTVPGHLRRDPSVHVAVSERRFAALLDAELPSPEARARIEAARGAGERIVIPGGRGLAAFETEARDMIDWLTSLPAADRHLRRIGRMSLHDALAMSRVWHQRMARSAGLLAASSEGVRTARTWDDGVRVVELSSPEALRREGAAMGHCVGGYWDRVRDGSCRIFSVRDAQGGSHVTVEIARPVGVVVKGEGLVPLARHPRTGVDLVPIAENDATVRQVRGRGNVEPVPRWAERVREFLEERDWSDGIRASSLSIAVHTVGGLHYADAAEALAEAGRLLVRGAAAGGSLARSMPAGTGAILGVADPEAIAVFSRRIVSAAGRRDAGLPRRSLLVSAGRSSVDLVAHVVPIGSIEIATSGIGGDSDVAVFGRVRTVLARILDVVEGDPGSVHALPLPAGCGVTPGMLNGMFLAAGLADRREAVLRRNAEGLAQAVRSLRDEARRAAEVRRRKGASADPSDNFLANLLRDDAVLRLRTLAAGRVPGSVVLGPPDAASARPAPTAAAAKPAAGAASRRMAELLGRRGP